MRIRPASDADVEQIVEVVNAAFAIEDFLEGPRTDAAVLREVMQSATILLAEDDSGQLVASVNVEVRGARGYFGMLAVHPSRQGGGVGRALVAAAEDHCRACGCRHMDITVLTLRPELPPLYRKLGYVETGRKEFCPSRPLKPGVECQAIVMSKAL